ncbi:MAG: iron-only hydrogenase system regulator [Desulfovibrio sp.]|nr:iron-only hydrogenase system regulator [Desulfovibrio sp.]
MSRVAIIGIIVENQDSVDKLNGILHQYNEIVIGRMGVPYRRKNINIISVAVDAPQDVISALAGKIGRLPGISAKAVYSNVIAPADADGKAG